MPSPLTFTHATRRGELSLELWPAKPRPSGIGEEPPTLVRIAAPVGTGRLWLRTFRLADVAEAVQREVAGWLDLAMPTLLGRA